MRMEQFAPLLPEPEKKKSKKRLGIILGIIIGVLIIGVGAAALFTKGFGLLQTTSNETSVSTVDGAEQSLDSNQAMISENNQKIAGGDLEAAAESYDAAVSQAPSDEDKANIMLSKSIAFGDAGHFQQSIDAALEAEKLYGASAYKIEATKEIAKRYDQLGNTSQAIVYTQKVLSMLQQYQSSDSYLKTYYERQLRYLEEKQ